MVVSVFVGVVPDALFEFGRVLVDGPARGAGEEFEEMRGDVRGFGVGVAAVDGWEESES